MSDTTMPTVGVSQLAPVQEESPKLINIAVIKKGAKDFLSFMDETKDIFFAYLYHAAGSRSVADALMLEIYLRLLSRAMSLWWFGSLSFPLLLKTAQSVVQEAIASHSADIDTVYLPTLYWLNEEERDAMLSLHDTLWTLPPDDQTLLILLYLVGVTPERAAQLLGQTLAQITARKEAATKLLFEKWHPPESLKTQMQSIVFVPTVSLARESSIRFAIVEKYNALRLRRMNWIMMGALLAVCSNFLIAGVLAFVVITQPPTSLRQTKADIVAFDAIELQSQQRAYQLNSTLNNIYQSAQSLGNADAARALTTLGLQQVAPAVLERQQKLQNIIKLKQAVDRAMISFRPSLGVRIAFDIVRALWRAM